VSLFSVPDLYNFYDWILVLIFLEFLQVLCLIFTLRLVVQIDAQETLVPLKCIGFSINNAWILWQIYGNIEYYKNSSLIHNSSSLYLPIDFTLSVLIFVLLFLSYLYIPMYVIQCKSVCFAISSCIQLQNTSGADKVKVCSCSIHRK